MRLDKHLQEVEGVRSRTYAASLVERGLVTVNGEVAHKVSREVSEGDRVEILSDDAFASRGAYKLKKAHEEFAFDAENLDCADIGCSNGGFTDLLLRLGARSVLAVDVGECALPEGLVNDPRVAFLRANARFPIPSPPKDFVVADLSFISLSLVLPTIYSLLKEGGRAVVLVKPQFELGRKSLGKRGIVTDKNESKKALELVKGYAKDAGFSVLGDTTAPVYQDKNTEYLLYLEKPRFASRTE